MIAPMTMRASAVRGVKVVELRHMRDAVHGDLAVIEFAEALPFHPVRCFWTYAIPGSQVRGEHAHRVCSQFLVSAHGTCRLRMDDGISQEEIVLDRPEIGVLVPPMVWAEASGHSADSVLLVLASHAYDPADYIRDYHEFVRIMRETTP
jgi:UDP-2-acetamido-3-amino-2,3-dideoxy-glucuronate N-acetyltransferase